MAECLEEMERSGIKPTEYDWKNYILSYTMFPGDTAIEESWRAMEAAEALGRPTSCHLYCAVMQVCQISSRPDFGQVGAVPVIFLFLSLMRVFTPFSRCLNVLG